MAESPIFCMDNYFDDLLNTGHTVSAEEEESGYEVDRLANGRRSVADYWSPTTANSSTWVKVDCGSSAAADFIAIDRGSNLEGKSVTLAWSTNDADWTNVFTATIPSSSSTDSDIDATNGAYTEEGAWVKRFGSATKRYWRLTIAAGGSGFTPRVVGLWLAAAWDPGEYVSTPHDEDASAGAWQAASNDLGWTAHSSTATPRQGELRLRLANFGDYDNPARAQLAMYRTGRPVWYVPDPSKAERSFLMKAPPGALVTAPYGDDWGYRTVRLPYIEHEPEIV